MNCRQNRFLLGTFKLQNIAVLDSARVRGNIFQKQLGQYDRAAPVEGGKYVFAVDLHWNEHKARFCCACIGCEETANSSKH